MDTERTSHAEMHGIGLLNTYRFRFFFFPPPVWPPGNLFGFFGAADRHRLESCFSANGAEVARSPILLRKRSTVGERRI